MRKTKHKWVRKVEEPERDGKRSDRTVLTSLTSLRLGANRRSQNLSISNILNDFAFFFLYTLQQIASISYCRVGTGNRHSKCSTRVFIAS